jgi:hypothetical protein
MHIVLASRQNYKHHCLLYMIRYTTYIWSILYVFHYYVIKLT